MEIEFSSYQLGERERFCSQSILVFLLALGLILWGNFIVFANPSSSSSIEEDSRVPLSKRVFDSSGEWRAPPQKSKNKWRESEEQKLTLQKDRIKKKTSSLYNPTLGRDNWDPYAIESGSLVQTTPATLFKFKF
jgi:hypothetical protein